MCIGDGVGGGGLRARGRGLWGQGKFVSMSSKRVSKFVSRNLKLMFTGLKRLVQVLDVW